MFDLARERDLLRETLRQAEERLRAAVLAEREACAELAEGRGCPVLASLIRARPMP